MSYLEAVSSFDASFASVVGAQLLDAYGLERAHEELDRFLDEQSVVDLAAHEYDWRNVWARPKQLPPSSDWESWGYLCGRGNGKTLTISKWVNDEVEAGRATSICLLNVDEDNAVKLMVTGPSGLIATAPPWNRPEWHVSELTLVWPNGAKAFVRTPEVPDKIRGFDYDLAWWSEIQSWPVATREAAMMNSQAATRIGYARTVWDATAKRRHPLLKRLLKSGEEQPHKHVVVRGSTHENRLNLAPGYIEKMEAAIGGTQQGREELYGEMALDSDGALVKSAWIGRNRRAACRVVRRVLSIDPAVTSRAGSDLSGIIVAGLSSDGKVLVEKDLSGKHKPEDWATIALDEYGSGECDLIVVETNKGGDLLVRNLRIAAKERGLAVIVLGKDERAPGHQRGVVHVREAYGRGAKEDRAQPLATAYERNSVCHVIGAALAELEETLTTWEPGPGSKSPDRLDALVYAVIELLGLSSNTPDPRGMVKGIVAANAVLTRPKLGPAKSIATLLGGRGRGRGI